MTEHPSLRVVEKSQPSPCAKKTDTIHEQLRQLKEQVGGIKTVDLSGVHERLDRIEVELTVLNSRKEEIDKRELEVLRLFALALEKDAEKSK